MFRATTDAWGSNPQINKLTLRYSQEYKNWFAATRNKNVNNAKHVIELIGFAHELLGKDLNAFIEQNYKRGVIGKMLLDFLIDTRRFAEGGHRNMELAVAARLLDEKVPPSRVDLDYFGVVNDRSKPSVGVTGASIYLTWTRNKNGVDDLANTLAILFT